MSERNQIEIPVRRNVDIAEATTLAMRVRAAMRNEIKFITLAMAPGVEITSAEFLAFLAAAAKYLEERGGRLSVSGADTRSAALLRISSLEKIIERN